MTSYQDLYRIVEKPLMWAAEDNGGIITRKEVKSYRDGEKVPLAF